MGSTKIKIVYMGLKRPKVIEITVDTNEFGEAKKERYEFIPFRETEVPEEVGKMLLRNAPDIFKRTDKEERKPATKPVVKTDGYVGDVHASEVPDLDKQKAKDAKAEEGKDIQEIIEERKEKAESAAKDKRRGKVK